MKAALCILLLAVAAHAVEEKKNEKRGLLGLGYGAAVAAHAPIISHGFYDQGLYGHGLAAAPLVSHGYYGHGLGLYGHGIAAAPVLSHSIAAAPVLSHEVAYSAPVYSSLGYSHGLGHGWH